MAYKQWRTHEGGDGAGRGLRVKPPIDDLKKK